MNTTKVTKIINVILKCSVMQFMEVTKEGNCIVVTDGNISILEYRFGSYTSEYDSFWKYLS